MNHFVAKYSRLIRMKYKENYSILEKIFMTPGCLWPFIMIPIVSFRVAPRISDPEERGLIIVTSIIFLIALFIFIFSYLQTNKLIKNGLRVTASFELIRKSVFDQLLVNLTYSVENKVYTLKKSISETEVKEDQTVDLLVFPDNHKKFRTLMVLEK